ncbi:MAG TPA: DNRLRE domain-containing protein [Ruminiclostridium sp.]|nr:DNRLRE domain-containing protein [Ruminiclostridium sp.]
MPSFPKSSKVALVPDASGDFQGAGIMPTSDTSLLTGFNQFTFSNLAIDAISSLTLSNYDTVVLLQIGDIQTVLTQPQKDAINAWIFNGGKLIIYDSDACNPSSGLPDYSWLIYPFKTENPGQLGANSGTLTIVENNTLSSNDPASPYYIDTVDVATNTDAVGDANVMITADSHWFGDMEATNDLGTTGWSHTYASYGSGLIIYDGLDTDYIAINANQQKIWLFELLQPWNPDNLLYSHPVSPCQGTQTTSTVNLPSTFIASGQPNTNYSAANVIYVGTVTGLGNCIGLLQIPALPALPPGATVLSATLQLGVFTKTGTSPSTVNVNRVLSPSPLNTTTVTYNTPVVYTSTGISKSIATSDINTNVKIDVTALVASWYAGTPDPGLALTCADGTLVLFDSANYATAANRPQLIITFCVGTDCTDATNVKICSHRVDTASETVTTADVNRTSTARDVSQITKVSFFVTNTGANAATVGIEESADGTTYVTHALNNVAPGTTIVLTPNYYSKFVRLSYHSATPGLPTTLLINYIAQA